MSCGRLLVLACAVLLPAACVGRLGPPPPPPPRLPEAPATGAPLLPAIGHSIQVGAFAELDNAVRLTEALEPLGLEPFHFADSDGLFKVRFGTFDDRDSAAARAESLRRDGIVDAYYVVPPERSHLGGEAALRRNVVRSAMGFLGQPYRWGGLSESTGFDCSGLAMAAYRLNGIALPRRSADQLAAGRPVRLDALREADLVFFATGSDRTPTHVGLHAGQGRFVHAPSAGKVVRIDALSDAYYRERLLAARTYF